MHFLLQLILDFGSGIGVTANYLAEHNDLDGIAVYNHGVISSFMDNEAAQKTGVFDMVDKASSKRFEGCPLDSLSIDKETRKLADNGMLTNIQNMLASKSYAIRAELYPMHLQ